MFFKKEKIKNYVTVTDIENEIDKTNEQIKRIDDCKHDKRIDKLAYKECLLFSLRDYLLHNGLCPYSAKKILKYKFLKSYAKPLYNKIQYSLGDIKLVYYLSKKTK